MYKYLSNLLIFIISINGTADFIKLSPEDALTIPLPLPYNEKIVTSVQLNAFINDSIAKELQPVIIFGGNWCPDCRILEGTLKIQTIKEFLQEHYQIMHIDIGRYDRNMELMNHLNIESKKGVPRVVILNLKKEVLNSSTSSEWTSARERKQQEIFNYFQEYVIKN